MKTRKHTSRFLKFPIVRRYTFILGRYVFKGELSSVSVKNHPVIPPTVALIINEHKRMTVSCICLMNTNKTRSPRTMGRCIFIEV